MDGTGEAGFFTGKPGRAKSLKVTFSQRSGGKRLPETAVGDGQ